MLLFPVNKAKVQQSIEEDIESVLSSASKEGHDKYNLGQIESNEKKRLLSLTPI
jgi:hypothetical protein